MEMSAANMIQDGRSFDPHATTLLEALEAIYMGGFDDERTGDVESPTGHAYRIERWIVQTDSQGFHYLNEFPTLAKACEVFARLDADYSQWLVTNSNDDELGS